MLVCMHIQELFWVFLTDLVGLLPRLNSPALVLVIHNTNWWKIKHVYDKCFSIKFTVLVQLWKFGTKNVSQRFLPDEQSAVRRAGRRKLFNPFFVRWHLICMLSMHLCLLGFVIFSSSFSWNCKIPLNLKWEVVVLVLREGSITSFTGERCRWGGARRGEGRG
jgi:hypothetical protein